MLGKWRNVVLRIGIVDIVEILVDLLCIKLVHLVRVLCGHISSIAGSKIYKIVELIG